MRLGWRLSTKVERKARVIAGGIVFFACGCPAAFAGAALSVTTTIDAAMTFMNDSGQPIQGTYEVINEAGYSTAVPGELPNDDEDEEIDATASISFAMPLASGGASASEHQIQAQTATSDPLLLVGVSASTFYAGPGNTTIMIAPHTGIAVTGSSTIDVTGFAGLDTVDAATEAFLDIYSSRGSRLLERQFGADLESGGHVTDPINLAFFNSTDVPLYAYYTSYVYFDATQLPVPEIGTRDMALLGIAGLAAAGGLKSKRRRRANTTFRKLPSDS